MMTSSFPPPSPLFLDNNIHGKTFVKFTRSDLTDLFADFNARKELWDCREEMVRSSIASVVHVSNTGSRMGDPSCHSFCMC